MGYNTKHSLEIHLLTDISGFETSESKKLSDLDKKIMTKDVIYNFLQVCEDARYAINDKGKTEESCSWYDLKKDLENYSKNHPNIVFIMSGFGEESGDVWKMYCINGKSEYIKAKMVFDEPNWNELLK